jgi:hypothetical protein
MKIINLIIIITTPAVITTTNAISTIAIIKDFKI